MDEARTCEEDFLREGLSHKEAQIKPQKGTYLCAFLWLFLWPLDHFRLRGIRVGRNELRTHSRLTRFGLRCCNRHRRCCRYVPALNGLNWFFSNCSNWP